MYEFFYTDEFKRDAKRLGRPMRKRLKKVIARILENPERFKHLREGVPKFSVRFELYRVLYKVSGNRVELIRVGKRDAVYD